MFSEAHTDTTFTVSSSVLGSNTGLVSGPPSFDIASIRVQIKSDVISTGTRVVRDSIVLTSGSWIDHNGVNLSAPTLNKLYIRVAYLGDLSTPGDDLSTMPNYVANPDGVIDGADQATFARAWSGASGVTDPVADLAPYEGMVPNVWSTPDGVIDVLDLMIFTTMHDWYNTQGFAATIHLPDDVNLKGNSSTDDGEVESEFLEIITNRIGDRMTVEYYVNDITDLMVTELMMLYNRDDYELISFTEGNFLNNGIFRGYEKDNGLHVFISNLDRANPGVSGSGRLLEIELELLGDVEDDYVIGFDLRNILGEIIESGSMSTGSYIPSEPPVEYALYAAYPNPFNGTTRINFDIARQGQASINVFNIRGQKVVNLIDGVLDIGKHSALWDANYAPTGTYFILLNTSGITLTQKIVLIK